MGTQLSLSIIEILVLMIGAITLGFTIHFFVVSRRSLNESQLEASGTRKKELESWKLKYFNDIEHRDSEIQQLKKRLAETEDNNEINTIEADEMRKLSKQLKAELESKNKTGHTIQDEYRNEEIEQLKKRLAESEENNEINTIEAEEMRKLSKQLKAELESLRKAAPVKTDTSNREAEIQQLKKTLATLDETNKINAGEAEKLRQLNRQLQEELESLRKAGPVMAGVKGEKPDYIEQLRHAQSSLLEHNEKINVLLGQIDIVKETEEKQQEILKINQELTGQVDELRVLLSQKEKEINNTRQKEKLSTEMTSMLDSAYNEFNVLQDKIKKLESQVNSSKRINLEYEDMKEGHYRLSQDYEEQKKKYSVSLSENKQLQEELALTEDQLKEANFQRQQLQKRVAYLEELNNDMQEVADANKKLEGQLKRIGELESMLNVVAEERDQLMKRHTKAG
jgi:hypothetical protein